MTMETRLLIFFVLMGLVLVATQYFYKPPPPPNKPAASNPANTSAVKPVPVAPVPAQPAPAPSPKAGAAPADLPGRIQSDKEQQVTIETKPYKVVFSNRGAVVKSWILKAYKDRDGHPLDLVNTRALDKVPAPFSLVVKAPLATDPNAALYTIDQPDPLTLNFEFSDGRAITRKSFRFTANSYLLAITSEVSQNGLLVPHQLAWRGGFGDQTVASATADEQVVYYDTKLRQQAAKEAKNGPVAFPGQYSFEGMDDKFFAGVFLPSGHAPSEVTVFADGVVNAAGAEEQRAGVAFGGEGVNIGSLFVGPKDTDLLRKIDPKLEGLIDWGWTEILAKPLFLALNWTNDHVVHNYGWAIVLLTIAINIVLSPLSLQSLKSSRKMQKIQPQITALNAKYKGIKMNDPRKSEQNQEMMDLYKREGVNPMGGCLPMLVQFPFLIAFYSVLRISIELRGANWLWVHDLSQPETIPIRILPVVLIVTQFLTQRMTPTPGVDPSQQKMMMFTPLIFGYIFWFLSSGLVLYYLTSNAVAIARQMILNRMSPMPAPAVVDVKPNSPKKRR
jgi:YidC/Oxa1 family membrane protein insertase